MRRALLLFVLGSTLTACGDSDSGGVGWQGDAAEGGFAEGGKADASGGDAAPGDGAPVDVSQSDALGPDASTEPDGGEQDAAPEAAGPTSCNFDYSAQFSMLTDEPSPLPRAPQWSREEPAEHAGAWHGSGEIAHADPPPPSTYRVPVSTLRKVPADSLTLPAYDDDMPLFERGAEWTGPTRCYETPVGVRELTQEQAYDLYQRIAERTTGLAMNVHTEHRTVVGLRGSYPGTFSWHGNAPNKFNDTVVLLWEEASTGKHVREFPVNTDTGAVDFGDASSSSIRANRRYAYVNGWHKTYNALRINESSYRVRDDNNGNGHWDSDRNGWLPPSGEDDYDRTGSGHNIHMGSMDGPLGEAKVKNWSAGCQVIPGMANWIEFITNAWTAEGDAVEYYLVDVRDIPPAVWAPCTPDGSHACPHLIDSLPFEHAGNTSSQGEKSFDQYNCSTASESGAEVVYELRVNKKGTLTVSVDCPSGVDVDVHLLDGDDAKACVVRNDKELSYSIAPGRYLIVVDTFASGGTEFPGAYTLHVSLK